ncbi:MAG TPA: hypothetical protein VNO35_13765 [Steroidobacteraceae bacterium]|nr:hypothetical protein [Steroidobacteraceae bacterium]
MISGLFAAVSMPVFTLIAESVLGLLLDVRGVRDVPLGLQDSQAFIQSLADRLIGGLTQ